MTSAFDIAAETYDETFTKTNIGRLQRNLVYNYLKKIKLDNPLNILELNCGTGEDAIWLTRHGHSVYATDISVEMINTAKRKTVSKNINNLIFSILDINNISYENFDKKFDLIFSNFGGINCLTRIELNDFFTNISPLLKPHGRVILIIMPKNCVWERFYFFLKGQWKKIYRRNRKTSLIATIEGMKLSTWYYNPEEIIQMSQTNFTVKGVQSIGLFVPPSYFESFFKNKLFFLKLLYTLEKNVLKCNWFAKYADHYLIDLQIK